MTDRIALLVMGMHRSGTSALTRMLSLLGAGLPKEILGAARGNDRGHWEPQLLVTIDDEIVQHLGEDWWDPAPIPRNWIATSAAKAFVARIAATIDAEYGNQPLIVIKDPRVCRLAPLYFAALAQLGIAPHAVLPLRHPGEVVDSISERDHLDRRISEMLWLRHVIEAEEHSRNCPRVWTGFEALLQDWRATASRIGDELGLVWPIPIEQAATAIAATLAPDLRHFDAASASRVGPLARRVWDAAQQGLAGDEAGLRGEFDAIRNVVDEIDRLAVPRIDSARKRLEAATRAQASLTASLARAGTDLAALIAADAGRVAEIESLQSTLAALQSRIDGLEASTSWRVTAPLRRAARLLGHPKQPRS